MRMITTAAIGLGWVLTVAAGAGAQTVKTESFDHDPGWDALNNRVVPQTSKTVHQDFGYSDTTFANKDKGEIGGTIWRGSRPASYARAIEPKTLSDRLSASGTFAITATSGSSSVFLGWFKSGAEEAGRQNSLGMRFAGQGEGARLTVQLVTATNQACGTKITPWVVDKTKPRGEGRKFRPPSIKNNGTHYAWKLDYDPDANGGEGQIQFTMKSDADEHDDFEGKTFTIALPKGYKQQGTTFDRFGLANGVRPGNPMTLFVDDLALDGKPQDFSADPKWIGIANRDTYVRQQDGGAHDFGYSATSTFAGGASPGEVGGTIWRSGEYAYYADKVGPLSLNDKLEASGKVVLTAGPPDSGMYIGWFNGEEKELSPPQAGNFVGVKVGGPTRVGHYFSPAYATTQTSLPEQGDLQHEPNISVERDKGPVLTPLKQFEWKLSYDPAASDGKGAITVKLGDKSVSLPLKDGDKAKGATLDHFGLFATHRGGAFVKIYFDDLTYTVGKASGD